MHYEKIVANKKILRLASKCGGKSSPAGIFRLKKAWNHSWFVAGLVRHVYGFDHGSSQARGLSRRILKDLFFRRAGVLNLWETEKHIVPASFFILWTARGKRVRIFDHPFTQLFPAFRETNGSFLTFNGVLSPQLEERDRSHHSIRLRSECGWFEKVYK
ncbi:hypothetical protein TNCV_3902461 [Trichonephila clavipes]|nr:hypothetical protein TNCV_3902461 [Trichonephila clavipes]